MECQYGPRRKGSGTKKPVEYDEHGNAHKTHRPTCPARIYVKKVRKFPEFNIDPNLEGKNVRQAQERALTALRLARVETGGEERFVKLNQNASSKIKKTSVILQSYRNQKFTI